MGYSIFNGGHISNINWQTFKVLPCVYEDSLSYMELLNKCLYNLNEQITSVNSITEAVELFETYVLNELSTYDEKIVTEVTAMLNGFITDGTIANLINEKFSTLSDKIDLINYRVPEIGITLSPTKNVYKYGEVVNGALLNTTLSKKTKDLTEIKYYKDNNVIETKPITTQIANDNYVDGSTIQDSTSYYTTISDGTTVVKSDTVSYTFVYPYYSGNVTDGLVINDSLVKSLTENVVVKGDIIKSVTSDGKKFLFAYPTSYGDLSSIADDNGLQLIESFTKSTLTMVMGDNKSQSYNIYLSNDVVYTTNYVIKFKI